jgi:hypothetical protein
LPTRTTTNFPHTCLDQGVSCHDRLQCPHYACGRYCRNKCLDFSCAKCGKFWDLPDAGPEQLMMHVKMYVLAKKYGVHILVELARVKFQVACRREWKAEKFVEAVEYVCENETIAAHMELVKKERLIGVLKTEMGLAHEVIVEKWCSGLWEALWSFGRERDCQLGQVNASLPAVTSQWSYGVVYISGVG